MAGIPGLSEFVKARMDSNGGDAKKDFLDILKPWRVGRVNTIKEKEYQDRTRLLQQKESYQNSDTRASSFDKAMRHYLYGQ